MPIIKSAIKRVRQQEKRRSRNLAAKRTIKRHSKLTIAAIAQDDLSAARKELAAAISQIDKAIKRGTLHRNTGARRKSSLTRAYNQSSSTAYGNEPKAKTKTATKTTTKPKAKPKTATKPKAKAKTKPAAK